MLRGQVARAVRLGLHRRFSSQTILASSSKSHGAYGLISLNTKDRVQLAAIARKNTAWAKGHYNG